MLLTWSIKNSSGIEPGLKFSVFEGFGFGFSSDMGAGVEVRKVQSSVDW